MEAHIQKWGNSLGLRIPMALAKQLNLQEGCNVTIEVENDQLIVQRPKYDLDTMLKNITKKNLHSPQLEDKQHGNEEW